MGDLLTIVFRSVIIYLFIVIGIRLFGKKELTQLSIIDLVFILLISNAVQNAMVGDNSSLLGGIVGAGALFVVNFILDNLFFHSRKLTKFVQGNPLMLIYQGKVVQKHLDQARISSDEIEAVVREHGVENIKDVDLAVLEVDGNISVLSKNYAHRTVKRRRAHKILGQNS
jgi:uncharacterized membrane protein YcaP (DUF421 family)